VYEGQWKPTIDMVVLILKASIILGMRELRHRSLEYINATLTKESALVYLQHTDTSDPGLADVLLSSLHVAAVSFNDYKPQDFNDLPSPILLEILHHGQLQCYDKTLSNCIASHIRANEGQMTAEEVGHLVDKLKGVALEDALFLLTKASQYHLTSLVEKCMDIVATHFDYICSKSGSSSSSSSSSSSGLNSLTPSTLIDLLGRDDLSVAAEDTVFDVIQEYHHHHTTPPLSSHHSHELWRCCRFAYLSLPSFLKALKDLSVPREMLAEGAIGHMVLLQDDGSSSSDERGGLHGYSQHCKVSRSGE